MREKERERESIIGFSKRLFCRQMKPTLPLRFRVLADQWTGNRDNNKIEKEPCSLPNFDRDCFTSLLYRIWIKFRSEKAHFHGTAQRVIMYLLIYRIRIKKNIYNLPCSDRSKVHKLSYATLWSGSGDDPRRVSRGLFQWRQSYTTPLSTSNIA